MSMLPEQLRKLSQHARLNELQNHFLFNLPFWIAATVTALLAVVYAKLFAWSEEWALAQADSYLILLTAPLGILLSFLIGHYFSKEAIGSGIPQIIASVAETSKEKRSELNRRIFSLRMILTKIIGSCFCVLGGGSTGREGPTLQISAAVFYQVSRIWPKSLPMPQTNLMVLAGGAGGLAAAFNTPLGGVVFAIEELSKTHISMIRTSIFQAVIICGIVAQMFMGNYLYLGDAQLSQDLSGVLMHTLWMAFVIGLTGAIFAQLLYNIGRWRARFSFSRQLVMTLMCGAAFSLLIYVCGESALGGGKHFLADALRHPEQGNILFPIARIMGNFLTYIAGVIGGIFAPALASGAAMAQYMSHELGLGAPRAMMLVGMVAFLTGVTRTPFTSFVLVLEMSDSHEFILYLMLSAFVASVAGYLVNPKSFYEQVAHNLRENQNPPQTAAPATTPPTGEPKDEQHQQ